MPIVRVYEDDGSFQSIGVTKDWRRVGSDHRVVKSMGKFPINRRHQGLATLLTELRLSLASLSSFQSIGVTKDWRPFGFAWVADKLARDVSNQ